MCANEQHQNKATKKMDNKLTTDSTQMALEANQKLAI